MTIYTISEARQCGFCRPGIEDWCARNGHDLRTVVKHGISEEDLIASGDLAILDRLRAAREEALGG